MKAFFALVDLTAPLFVLVGVGFVLSRWGRWPLAAADALTRFVFSVAIPTQFDVLTGPVASATVLTTVLAAASTPLVLTLIDARPP